MEGDRCPRFRAYLSRNLQAVSLTPIGPGTYGAGPIPSSGPVIAAQVRGLGPPVFPQHEGVNVISGDRFTQLDDPSDDCMSPRSTVQFHNKAVSGNKSTEHR